MSEFPDVIGRFCEKSCAGGGGSAKATIEGMKVNCLKGTSEQATNLLTQVEAQLYAS